MSAIEALRAQTADDWRAATTYAFTDVLADGTLDREKIARYLQQDYLFVEGFVRLLASAVAHAPNLSDAVPGAQFLRLICGPENTYFPPALEAHGVPQANGTAPETCAFQTLMDDARRSGRYEIMLSVLVVAEWIYLDWATRYEDKADELPFWLGEWITLPAGAGVVGVVAYLRAQLDAVWLDLDDAARAAVEVTFAKTVTLERAFFDAARAGFPVAH